MHSVYKWLLFSFTVFFLASIEPIDEILKKHIKATGHKKIEKLGLIKQEGTLLLGGEIDIKFISYHYNGSVRMEYYYFDDKDPAVTVYTPDTAWKVPPWNLSSIEPLTKYELENAKVWAQLSGILINNKVLNYELTIDESMNENSGEIVVTANKSDMVTKIHTSLNSRNYLISKTEMIEWTRGAEQKTVTNYYEYKSFKGLMLPTRIEKFTNGNKNDVLKIDEVEVGQKFKKKLFEKP
ncbi:MAG: hypothetical protein JXQ87_06560 [Bacteroidia bacterium]